MWKVAIFGILAVFGICHGGQIGTESITMTVKYETADCDVIMWLVVAGPGDIPDTFADSDDVDVFRATTNSGTPDDHNLCAFSNFVLSSDGDHRVTISQNENVSFLFGVQRDTHNLLVNLTQLEFEVLDNFTDCTQENSGWSNVTSSETRYYTETGSPTEYNFTKYGCDTEFVFGKANTSSPDVTSTRTTTTTITSATTTSSTTHPDEEHLRATLSLPPSFSASNFSNATLKVYPKSSITVSNCHLEFAMVEGEGINSPVSQYKSKVTTFVLNFTQPAKLIANDTSGASACYDLTESQKAGKGTPIYYTYEIGFSNGTIIQDNVNGLSCGFADDEIESVGGEGAHKNELRVAYITSNLTIVSDVIDSCDTDPGIITVDLIVSLSHAGANPSRLSQLMGASANAHISYALNISEPDECDSGTDVPIVFTDGTFDTKIQYHDSCTIRRKGRPILFYQYLLNGVPEVLTGDCALPCPHNTSETCRGVFTDVKESIIDERLGTCSRTRDTVTKGDLSSDDDLSDGAIVGIVLGSIFGVTFFVVGVMACMGDGKGLYNIKETTTLMSDYVQ